MVTRLPDREIARRRFVDCRPRAVIAGCSTAALTRPIAFAEIDHREHDRPAIVVPVGNKVPA